MANIKQIHEMARIIFNSTWSIKGLEYSTRRGGDWRSRDAQRAAEYILSAYDVARKSDTNGERQ